MENEIERGIEEVGNGPNGLWVQTENVLAAGCRQAGSWVHLHMLLVRCNKLQCSSHRSFLLLGAVFACAPGTTIH